jgi:uncharacterized protein (TIGR03083 family)
MTREREELVVELPVELETFGRLIRDLDEEAWATPSRCEGWAVADVAGHVVGEMADIAAGRLEGLGTPEVTEREVEERRGRSPAELADELAAAVEVMSGLLAVLDEAAWASPIPSGATLGEGVEALHYDTWAHAEDIRAALGLEPDRGGGLTSGVHHVAQVLGQQGWGPAVLALDGMAEIEIPAPAAGEDSDGAPGAAGEPRRVTGDPYEFVLVASGRGDPDTLGLDETVNLYRVH